MSKVIPIRPARYRAVFLSDVHLGSRSCKAEFLLEFLREVDSEYLYLVGDIVDLWAMSRGLYWPQGHNEVVREILGKARRGTRVVYVPGNHDHPLREHVGLMFGNVELHERCVHETRDGRRLLVLHGDEFDSVIPCSRLLSGLGSASYDLLLYLNRLVNGARRLSGLPYWSLAAFLKQRVRNAVRHIRRFEVAVTQAARAEGVDGVVCGHIHHPELHQRDGILYCNDGDWVESCTALVEHHDGALQLLYWADRQHALKTLALAG